MINWRNIQRHPEHIQMFTAFKDRAMVSDIMSMLKHELIAHDGLGIAAPQVGLNYRVFMIKDGNPQMPIYRTFFNPTYNVIGDQYIEIDEGCLSIPGFWAKTRRYSRIQITYQTHEGVTDVRNLTSYASAAAQHEMEHLEGKLFPEQIHILSMPHDTLMAWNKYKELANLNAVG
jgi:peptide deformylase